VDSRAFCGFYIRFPPSLLESPDKIMPTAKSARKRTASLMKPVQPDDTLVKIVGSKPLPRTELTKKLWDYIKKNKLQDAKKKTLINADDALKAVLVILADLPNLGRKDQMKREPTQEEREKIVRAIAAGDRIRATSTYISITECGLTEAQKLIKALTTEAELRNPEKFAKRQQNRHRIRFWVS
jgi:hypothetical protein